MRLTPIASLLLLASCAAPPPPAPSGPSIELAGRSPGAPQRCITIDSSNGLRVADGDRHTLLTGSGRQIWSNSLGPHCGFGRDDVLVFEPLGSQYCRGDIVRSVDRYSRIPGPSCVLGDFVPYTRS